MRIKIDQKELKDILDKHFGGVDTHYDIEVEESNYALATRYGRRIGEMERAPEVEKHCLRAIFEKMSVFVSVSEIKNEANPLSQ